MGLPAPINWLGRAAWDEPQHWGVSQAFVNFLRANSERCELIVNWLDKTFQVISDDLGTDSDFKARFLGWGLTHQQRTGDARNTIFGAYFPIFQAAVFCEINQWFAANAFECDRAFLNADNQDRRGKIDWADKFWGWLGRSSRHMEPDFTDAALDVSTEFGNAVWNFMLLGGSLFGVEWLAFSQIRASCFRGEIVSNIMMDGEENPVTLHQFLTQRGYNSLESFADHTNNNLGFEGLGSLFG